MLEEYTTATTPAFVQRYVYGNYIDETLCIDNGTAKHYYIHDQLFSTVALVDTDGAVAERYEYDAYGKTTAMDDTFTDIGSSNYANPYLFTGRRLDILGNSSLKIYYYRARNYDPDTGRFLQHDPFGYVDGMNLYEYVSSNPATYADPMGLYEVDEMINTFVENYGAEGTAMLAMAMYDGWYIDKADYWLDDWDYQNDGTLGIASSWWGGIDDSKETAAKQLYDALYNKYGGALSEFMQGAAKCICGSIDKASREEGRFEEAAGTDIFKGESQRIASEAAKGGAYFQRLAEDELKMYLCGFAAGAIVSKGADAFDGWNDWNKARRAAKKAASKVDDVGRGSAKAWEIGKLGEDAVRAKYDIGDKVKIAINGRKRIPDGLTKTTLSEVKNVKSLSYTRQLRDYADYAAQRGLQFDLYVRPNDGTILSGPLKEAYNQGIINIMEIPGI